MAQPVLVGFRTTSTGAGAIAVSAASPGYRLPSAALTTGWKGRIAILRINAAGTVVEREVSNAVYDSASGGSFTRTLVGSTTEALLVLASDDQLREVFVIDPDPMPWELKTTTYTAKSGDSILADTSGAAWTLTLPAAPVDFDQVRVRDVARTWDTNNLTIARNGKTIAGLAENLTCDIEKADITLVYYNGDWSVG